jgi:thiamine kinase-like enzyme
LGIDLGLAVVVQEHFVGDGLGRHLAGPSPDRALRLASAALAALHQLPAKLDSHVDRDSCFEEAEAAAARLPADRAGIATAALERARRLLSGSLQQPVPSHGDLGWSQLLDQGKTVAMVDFDKAGMAERGLDLGNLFAQTVRSGLEPNRALGLMTAYAEVAGVDVSESAVGYALLILARKLDRLPERRVAQIQRTLEAILSWELAMA